MDFIARQFQKYPRTSALLAVGAAFVVLYLGTNHLNVFSPHYLPLFAFENLIPFVPWTVIIYLSTFPLVAAALLLVRREDLHKSVVTIIKIILFLSLVFLFYPTTYPRPDLPPGTAPSSRLLYDFLTKLDTPKNCFPSLHVTMSVFVAFILRRRNRRLGALFLIWACAIMISTLTLKQHYLLDVVAGIFLAVIFYYLFFVKKRRNISG
jgi:membrane-associated phospholipid phosphatase